MLSTPTAAMRAYHQTMADTVAELIDYRLDRGGRWIDVAVTRAGVATTTNSIPTGSCRKICASSTLRCTTRISRPVPANVPA